MPTLFRRIADLEAQRNELQRVNTEETERRRAAEAGFSLSRLQAEQREWSERNFGPHPAWHPLLGVVEEVGELAHAFLKAEQGIRGSREELEAEAKDAVADAVIFLSDFCTCAGFNLEAIVELTWDKVKRRDWKRDPQKGGTEAEVDRG